MPTTNQSELIMAHVLFVFLSVIWSSNFFMMKKAGLMFGPVTIAAAGFICGSLAVAVFWKLRNLPWGFKRKHIFTLCVLIVVSNVYPFITQPFLVGKFGHGFVGMMLCLIPIYTIIISIPVLKKYPTGRELLGVLGGFAGIVILMRDGLNRDISLFYLLVTISVPFAHSFGLVIVSRYFKDIPPVTLCMTVFGLAGTALLPVSLSMESVNMEADIMLAVMALLVLSFFGRGLGNVIFYYLIQNKGPLFTGMIMYVIPVGTLACSWLDGETITFAQTAGVVFILLMVWLAQSKAKPKRSSVGE